MPAFVGELCHVACDHDRILGCIVYTRAKSIDEGEEHTVLCMGPPGVLPAWQKSGIGSTPMNSTIPAARELGYAGIVLFGSPDYYHRFGFRNAANYGITTSGGKTFEAFMTWNSAKGV